MTPGKQFDPCEVQVSYVHNIVCYDVLDTGEGAVNNIENPCPQETYILFEKISRLKKRK